MKKLKTLILTYLKKHCSLAINQKNLWMQVPSICKTRRDKDEIIMTMIEHLEQNIKIK